EELVAKRVELMHEAVPKTTSIALLVNPTSPNLTEAAINDAQTATRSLGTTLLRCSALGRDWHEAAFAAAQINQWQRDQADIARPLHCPCPASFTMRAPWHR